MEVKIQLFKREGTYFSEQKNKDIPFVNFYISCNDKMIPVEVKYFPNPALQNRDPGYSGRVAVLSMLAERLPERENTGNQDSTSEAAPLPSDKDVPPQSKNT